MTSKGPCSIGELAQKLGLDLSPLPFLFSSVKQIRKERLFDFNLNTGHWRLHFPWKMSAIA